MFSKNCMYYRQNHDDWNMYETNNLTRSELFSHFNVQESKSDHLDWSVNFAMSTASLEKHAAGFNDHGIYEQH